MKHPSCLGLNDAFAELAPVAQVIEARFSTGNHGDYPRWQTAIDALPPLQVTQVQFESAAVTLLGEANTKDTDLLHTCLMHLHPWRKGPFDLFGVIIDAEWRSDWKWKRIRPYLDDLRGRRILDVGCGNGYFGWRHLGAGATAVLGVDPTLLFCMQHHAINTYVESASNFVVPLKFEELPALQADTVFSLGVIYHRRDPHAHLSRLLSHTRPGGQVVVESLVVEQPPALQQSKRYARMRNVWWVPTPQGLADALHQAGFVDVQVVDVTRTTVDEQRSTAWMRFDSLTDALEPNDHRCTVEGLPAPIRATAIAHRPT